MNPPQNTPQNGTPLQAVTPVIRLRGARVHNLRSLDLDIPRDQLVVLSGVSGSGKSSLAFDTLFAEGQRRYLESLSTYTRQFLDQWERPEIDSLDGLPPTLSIDQRVGTAQPRSTLATTTEIYDFLRLLYARAGTLHCYQCGRPVSQQSAAEIVAGILNLAAGNRVMILAPVIRGRKGTHRELFEKICREGFVRARVDGELVDASDPPDLKKGRAHDIDVVIDRIVVKEGIRARLQESVELALKQGEGSCLISHQVDTGWEDRLFSSRYSCPDCQLSFPPIEPRTFSFNSPYGACPRCEGLGVLSSGDPATPPVTCPDCQGARLGPVARAVTIAGQPIHQWTAMTVAHSTEFANSLLSELRPEHRSQVFEAAARLVAEKTLPDIATRLEFLKRVGLDYLTLDRPANTLSGGEFQRARLASCLGSALTGVCYILDEPTIGLHPRDTLRLLATLRDLQQQGNSVLVVEHDLQIIAAADTLIELGPGAGKDGGQLVTQGPPAEVLDQPQSITGPFLRSDRPAHLSVARPVDLARALVVEHATAHNLRDLGVSFPLGALVCVTGVSGSGKTSLVLDTLVPLLRSAVRERDRSAADLPASGAEVFREPGGAVLHGAEHVDRLVEIDQAPLGRNARSIPATAAGLWDDIRRVFARTREARVRGFTASRFSFNARGGRCEECKGQGRRRVQMHFLPDMEIVCPVCRGARFNRQTLQVRFRGKNIADILQMRIDEAAEYFQNFAGLRSRLQIFSEVGLGYLTLGQSSLTLSGGEAQRIKLARELGQPTTGRALYVLDEPTTGLHSADIARLLQLLRKLVDAGHSVLVIEHELEVIAMADWIIDLGPEGGAGGGRLVACGTPADLVEISTSHTGAALRHFGRR